jgi:glycosyltransferase involved in cell wall biosynthesis
VREQVREGLDVHVVYLKGEPELKKDLEKLRVKVHSDLVAAHVFKQPLILRRITTGKNAIVHAHLPRAELIALFSPARFTFIVSRHNTEPFFPGAPKFLSNILSRAVSVRAKKVIAISEAVKVFLSQRGEILNPQKIHVVLYGYQQTYTKEFRIQKNSRRFSNFGSISRLTEQKDIPTMMLAFRIIKKSIPNSTLSLVGAGPLEPDLRTLAKKLELESSVQFLGRTENITRYLDTLDVFILTSQYEGFGLVLLEAMDAGIPIVASRNSAIPEVLGSEFPGLCETSNQEDFAAKTLRLRETEYRDLVLAMQEDRLSMFNAPQMAKKVNRIYFS